MHWMLMPLRRYADFSGRSRRLEYWLFALFQVLLYVGLFVLCFGMGINAFRSDGVGLGAVLGLGAFILIFFVIWLALLVPSLAVAVRRLHDTGRSGWWFGGYFLLSFGLNIVSGAAMTTLASGARSPEEMMRTVGIVSGVGGIAILGYGLLLLVFFCLDGTPGPNRYGPDPKGRADAGNVFV